MKYTIISKAVLQDLHDRIDRLGRSLSLEEQRNQRLSSPFRHGRIYRTLEIERNAALFEAEGLRKENRALEAQKEALKKYLTEKRVTADRLLDDLTQARADGRAKDDAIAELRKEREEWKPWAFGLRYGLTHQWSASSPQLQNIPRRDTVNPAMAAPYGKDNPLQWWQCDFHELEMRVRQYSSNAIEEALLKFCAGTRPAAPAHLSGGDLRKAASLLQHGLKVLNEAAPYGTVTARGELGKLMWYWNTTPMGPANSRQAIDVLATYWEKVA